MEINKTLKSEHSILLNARKAVVITFIIFVIYIIFSTFSLGYGKDIYFGGWNINELPLSKRLFTLPVAVYENNADYYSMIFTLLIITYAIFCGRLYNIMSKNIILSFIIGILIIGLSWVALGIVTHLLTIYLLVKSDTALKKLDLNFTIPSEKITSFVLTEENKMPITEEVFRQESKAKKDLDYDEAYKKALYFIDKEDYDKALLYLEMAIKTDIISLKEKVYVNIGFCYGNLGNHIKAIEAFKQVIRIDPDHTNSHFSLGFSYFKTGDKSSALDEYKILKNLDINLANRFFDLIY